MSNPLRTLDDYELYVYSLGESYPEIRRSTLTVVRRGVSLARVAGEVFFDGEFRLVVRERLLFDRTPGTIDWYGYEVWKGETKLFWYDSQPHPNNPDLQSTHPHHKHVPPDMKHNRIPAPNMSFIRPNLSVVIEEVRSLIHHEGSKG